MNLVLCLSSHRLHDTACHSDSFSHRTLSLAFPFKLPFFFWQSNFVLPSEAAKRKRAIAADNERYVSARS